MFVKFKHSINLSDVVKLYDKSLLHLLDKHVPEKCYVITICHTQKGMTDHIKCERRKTSRADLLEENKNPAW